MDLSLRTTTTVSEDRSWLKDATGIHTAKGTLDYSAFTQADHYPNGYFKSGLGLRKLASGLLGPAGGTGGADHETQSIAVDGTGGTWTIAVAGETTAAIAWNATAAAVQAALELLVNIEAGDITVTGGPGNSGGTTPYLLTFGGNLGGQDVPIVVAADSLTGGAGTATVTTVNAGSGSAGTPAGLLFSTESAAGATDLLVAVMDAGNILSDRLPANSGWDASMAAALPRIADYS